MTGDHENDISNTEQFKDTEQFEADMAARLHHRADALTVHQDLDHVLAQVTTRPTPDGVWATARRSLPPWASHPVSAAAVVLIVGLVGVLGVSRLNRADEEFAVQEAIAEVVAADATTSEYEPSLQPNEAVLWLSVNVNEAQIQWLRQWLDSQDAVLGYRYVDRDATYAEFTEYFADKPEIIELVEPEFLPTSFVVTTESRDAMTTAAKLFSFVEQVDFAEEP